MPLWMQNSCTNPERLKKNKERIVQIKQEKQQLLDHGTSVGFLDSRTEPAYRRLHREQLLLESILEENLAREGDGS